MADQVITLDLGPLAGTLNAKNDPAELRLFADSLLQVAERVALSHDLESLPPAEGDFEALAIIIDAARSVHGMANEIEKVAKSVAA